jgi:hypothetical protein
METDGQTAHVNKNKNTENTGCYRTRARRQKHMQNTNTVRGTEGDRM